jgi:hypothetical protein
MKTTHILIFLAFGITIIGLLSGCSSKPSTDSVNDHDWIENNGLFYTHNINKAQKHVPFRIALPTNITEKPIINGTLSNSSNDSYYSLKTEYILSLDNNDKGFVNITQTNKPSIPNDSKNESLSVDGIDVTMWEGKYLSGSGYFFFFNKNNIYFIVETYNITYQKSNEILSSLISSCVSS